MLMSKFVENILRISRQNTASAVRAFPNGTRMRLMECSD